MLVSPYVYKTTPPPPLSPRQMQDPKVVQMHAIINAIWRAHQDL